MRKASIRDLRYSFKKIERLLYQGEEIQITKRRRVIARLIPEGMRGAAQMPDFSTTALHLWRQVVEGQWR